MSATHQKIMIAKKATQNSLYEPNFDPEKDLNGGGILQILFKEPSENYFDKKSPAEQNIPSQITTNSENEKNIENYRQKLDELLAEKIILQNQISQYESQKLENEKKLTELKQQNLQERKKWQQEKLDILDILKQRAFWQQKSQQKSQELDQIQQRIDELQKLLTDTQMDKVYWQEQNIEWQNRWSTHTAKWHKQEQKWQDDLSKLQRSFILQIKNMEKQVWRKERIWLASIIIIFTALTVLSIIFFQS
jgi:hypothetical protein